MTPPVLTPEGILEESRSVGGFSVSSDGLSVAFSWSTKSGKQIYTSSLEEFDPLAVTEGPGSKVSPNWSPDGTKIAFLQDEDGNEEYSIFIIERSGGPARRVTHLSKCICRSPVWSPDGKTIAFSSNFEGSFDIYLIGSDGSNLRRMTTGSKQYASPQWSPDGRWLLYGTVNWGVEEGPGLHIVSSDGTEHRSMGCGSGTANRWSPDGSQIAFGSHDSRGVFNIGVIDFDTEEVEWLTKEAFPVYLPVWSPDSSSIACLTDKDGDHRVALLDLRSASLREIGLSSGLCSAPEYTPDSSTLVFTHEGPRNPTDLWKLSIMDGHLTQLTSGCPDSINAQDLVQPESVSYPSHDGLEIPAFLFRPSTQLPDSVLPPAIIWLHGGPNYQFTNRWNPTIQLLTSRGYLLLAPNYRGSTGYGREFTELSRGDWGGGDLSDVIAAAEYLESAELADAQRIALWGGSYGGYLILMALAKAPKLWAAAVDFYGFVNLESFYRNTSGYIRDYVRTQIGTPDENSEFYHNRSPINFADKITAPLLFFQGANDPRVLPSESEQLIQKLADANTVCQLKVYENEGHGFQVKSNQIDAMRTALEFLEMHLGRDGE
jgi:dipeptidyl aminopeptidase/acylaminoacyl peptidase